MSDETGKATEEQYDTIIAPMLLEVARKCKELGMQLVVRCEWQPGEAGITHVGDSGWSASQRLARAAAFAHGNIDSVCLHLIKHCDVSESIFLAAYNRHTRAALTTPNNPPGHETPPEA